MLTQNLSKLSNIKLILRFKSTDHLVYLFFLNIKITKLYFIDNEGKIVEFILVN